MKKKFLLLSLMVMVINATISVVALGGREWVQAILNLDIKLFGNRASVCRVCGK